MGPLENNSDDSLTPKPGMEVAVVTSVAPCGFLKNCRNNRWVLRVLKPQKVVLLFSVFKYPETYIGVSEIRSLK